MSNRTIRARPEVRPRFDGLSVIGPLLTICALAALIAHLADPKLKIDSIAIALIVVAALPWLGGILESFDLPGGGGVRYRKRLANLERKTARVEQQATRVAEQVDDVVESSQDARGEFAQGQAMARTDTPPPVRAHSANTVLSTLAKRYDEIRAAQPPGFERTSAMTAVAQEMISVSESADAFDWRSALASADRGFRLAAYAYLCLRPQRGAGKPLTDTLLHREDKPFGQYWALKALRSVAELDDVVVDLRPDLEAFRRTVGPGTDRAGALDDVISVIDAKAPSAEP